MSINGLPSPLTPADISVGGTLGQIAREQAIDYTNKPLAQEVTIEKERPSFTKALSQKDLSIIAEIKRASPSKGNIANLDPVKAAKAYQRGGAKAISILTEPRHFQGKLSYLTDVANEVSLPLLRKDFTVHPLQLFEAKNAGASAVLLIVAVLQNHTRAYLELAQKLALAALVEVHDEIELQIALEAGVDLLGINNRDLKTLTIDLNNAPRLISFARAKGFKGLLVAESGYSKAEELQPLIGLADAVLIGTSIAGSGDLEGSLRKLLTNNNLRKH